MGSISCFSEPVFFRDLYHIFLVSVRTLSGSFLFNRYFSVPYLGLLIVPTEICFHTTQYYTVVRNSKFIVHLY